MGTVIWIFLTLSVLAVVLLGCISWELTSIAYDLKKIKEIMEKRK